MKKLNKKLALFLVTAMLSVMLSAGFSVTAFADTWNGDFRYTEVVAGESVKITGYSDSAAGGHVTIPASLGGMTVVEIGTGAFSSSKAKDDIQDIDMSGSPNITSIDDNAFKNCSNLTDITLSSSLKTIGEAAFMSSGLESVEIPSGVTSIGNNAFSYCDSLTSVTFDSGSDLTTIGESAFYKTGITSITIPSGVTAIGASAFESSSLKKVNFASSGSLTDIYNSAFKNTKITRVTIPSTVDNIEAYAFNSTYLTSVIFNTDTVNIDETAFNRAFMSTDANKCMFYGNSGSDSDKYANADTSHKIPFYALDLAVGTPVITAAESTGTDSIFITWSPAANAQYYKIDWGTTAALNNTEKTGITKTSYSFSGLTTGTVYYFQVTGYCIDNSKPYDGIPSDIKSVAPALLAPSSVSVKPSSPNGYNSLTITWSPVTGATGYKVYRSTSLYGAYTLLKSVTGVTTFMNTGLITNSTYYYKVCAFITAIDPVTNKPTTTTTGALSAAAWGAPKLAQVTGLSVGTTNASDALKLSWTTVLGRTGYEIQRADDEDFTDNLKTISVSNYIFTNTGLLTGSEYYYRVRAYRTISGVRRYGAYSLIVSGTPVLHQVMGLTARALSSTTIKLSWSAVSGKKIYYIIYSYDPDTDDSEEIGRGSSTTFYDRDLDPSTTYEYYVVVYKLVGTNEDEIDADPSVTVSVKTMAATS